MKKISIILMVMICFTLYGCSKTKTIDLTNYAEVSYTGLDGKGTANLRIKWGDFENDILSEADKEDLSAFSKIVSLEESIKYSLDKQDELSNGDTLNLTITWDEKIAKKHNLKFTGKKKELVVNDLKVPVELDLFQDIHIEYSEVAPEAKATIRNAASDSFLKTVTYKLDHTSGLSNGDTITVTAQYNKESAEHNGYVITATEKSYVVDGIDEYITSYETIDDITLSEMNKQATDVIDSALASGSLNNYLYPDTFYWSISKDSLEILNIDLVNSYFFVLKKGIKKDWGRDANNSLVLVYKVEFKTEKTTADYDTVYLPISFKDIILRDTGVLDVKITDAKIIDAKSNNFDNLYRDIVTAKKANYEYEEISH